MRLLSGVIIGTILGFSALGVREYFVARSDNLQWGVYAAEHGCRRLDLDRWSKNVRLEPWGGVRFYLCNSRVMGSEEALVAR